MLRLKIIMTVFVIFSCIASFADEVDDFIADSKSEESRVRANYAELLGNYKDERTFARLLELAQDNDDYVRWKAADSLAKLGDKRAVPILKEVLIKTKGDKNLREYVGEALYKLGDKSLIPFWIECLSEQDPWLTELFVRAIVKYDYRGKEASDILIKDLESKNEKIKICAAYALAYTEEPKAYKDLLKLLVDNSFEVRQMAILALGHIGNKDATPYLILALDDENNRIRIAAYYSLYRLGDPRGAFGIIDALTKEKDDRLRQYAVVTLGKIKAKDAVPILLVILDEQEPAGDINKSIYKSALKTDAIKALGEIGDKNAKERLDKFFKEVTSSGTPRIGCHICTYSGSGGLGEIGPYIPFLDKGIPLTNEVSNHTDMYEIMSFDMMLNDPLFKNDIAVITKKTIQKIESNSDKCSSPPEFTRSDYDKMMQSAKVKLDGFKPSYFASLVDQLKNDKDTWQRVKAAKDLGISKDKNAITPLIEVLNDPNKNVRAESINSLALIGDKSAILPLKGKLIDKEEFVQKRAAEALALIADSNNDMQLLEEILLGQNKEISCAAIGALGMQERKNSIPILIKCLHVENKRVKKSALGTINRIGAKEVAPDLYFLLEDKDPEIRIETIRILGYFHDVSAVDKLIQMYDTEDIQGKSAILSTFAYFKDPRTIPLLKKAMHDENEQIKYQATSIMQSLSGVDSLVSLDELKSNLDSGDLDLERNAVESLDRKVKGPADKEAWLLLNSALKHKDIKIRRLAALKIRGGNPEAFPILIDMLNDKKLIEAYINMNKAMNGEINESEYKLNLEDMQEISGIGKAISTLGIHAKVYGFQEAKETFIKLLDYDLDDYTKALLIEGLGSMGDKESMKAIKPFLAKEGTKDAAAAALGKLGDKSVLPLLVEHLNKGFYSLELCEAFIGIGKPAVEPLIKALDNPNPEIRELAIHALGQIGDKSATPYLIKLIDENNPTLTGNVIIALGNLGDKQALPILINLYNSKKINLRKEILGAFTGLPDKSIEPLLMDVIKDKNSTLEFKCMAIETLARIKDAELVGFFENLLKDENETIKLTAAYALCKIGKSEYETYLKEALKKEGLYYPAVSMLIDLKGEDALSIIENICKDKPEEQKKVMRMEFKMMLEASKKRQFR